jgi:hypothetical protein
VAEASPSQSVSLLFRHCSGFRVQSADGDFGFVEDVLYEGHPDEPAALAVRSGLFHERVEIVPLEAIAEIVAGERRIVLRPVSSAVVSKSR